MKIKYKTDYKLRRGNETIAYKIYAGFYVFFISPSLYEEALESGLIEKQNLEDIKVYLWTTMRMIRGKVTEHRIETALKLSNLVYLKESLERVNQEIGLYLVSYYRSDTLCWTATLDTSTFTLEAFEKVDITELWNWRKESITYIFIIDYLCDHLDRTYMNSRHLIEKLEETGGIEENLGHCISFNKVKITKL